MRVCPPLIRTTSGQNTIKSGAISPLFLVNWVSRCNLPFHWSVVVYWPSKPNFDWLGCKGWVTEFNSVLA